MRLFGAGAMTHRRISETSAGSVSNAQSGAAAQSFYLLLTTVGLMNGRAVKRDKLVKNALIRWLFFP